MKSLTLIKQHPCVQLAHLYEHMYCNEVKKILYKKGLFKHTDFSLRGTTYEQGGIIEINIELHSPEARRFSDTLFNLAVNTENTDALNLALRQICSEEEGQWNSKSPEKMHLELKKLANQRWKSTEQFGFIDTKSIRRLPHLMYIEEKRLPSKKILMTLSLDQEFTQKNRTILPLFSELSQLLSTTAADYIGLRHGDYVFDSYYTRNATKTELLVYKGATASVDLHLYAKTTLESIKHQLLHQSTSRLLTSLQSPSCSMSTTESILHDTDIYIGTQGWREIATQKNLAKLWPHISVTLQFGRGKLTMKLPDLHDSF